MNVNICNHDCSSIYRVVDISDIIESMLGI